MNRSLMIALVILAPHLIAAGQVTSIKESGPYQPDTSKNLWRDVVQNLGSSQVVFFHATFRCRGVHNRIEIFHDPLWRFGLDKEVPPGGSVEIDATDPSRCPGGVDAIAFSDGHYEGDPDIVNGMYLMHRGTYNALGEAQQLLDAIANGAETAKHAESFLEQREKSTSADLTMNANERVAMDSVFSMVRQALEIEGTLKVPSDSTANRHPSIAQVAKEGNLSRERAEAIVLGNSCKEWKSALEGHIERPDVK